MGIGTILPLIVFLAIFYFLLIRPQQKRTKQTKEMQSSLGKGDKITTIGGLHGIVDTIDDSTVTIKCNGNTRLTFDRQSIREIVQSKTNPHEKHEKKEEVSLEKSAGEAEED